MSFGPYTDALPYGGWDENTVGYMIERALSDLGRELSDAVTRNDCYAWLTECLREITGKQLRWPDLYRFNESLEVADDRDQLADEVINGDSTSAPTELQRGLHRYRIPLDAYDRKSNKSILAIRLSTDGTPLRYVDPIEFERRRHAVASARYLGSPVAVGSTQVSLGEESDFASSGTINYYVDGALYSFDYDDKNDGDLEGIPASGEGSIEEEIPFGTYLWQGEREGTPTHFTVREEGFFEIDVLPDAAYHNKNIYLDYATKATRVDSDGDTIDVQRFDILQPYLAWRMDAKFSNSGKLNFENGFYLKYKERLNDAIRTLPHSISFRPAPRVNHMRKR